MDRFLDEARCGPTWMKRDDVAQIVADAIRYAAGTLSHYELHAYVVMANHVHLLILPLLAPSKLLQSVKGFSAREANKLLGRSGELSSRANHMTTGFVMTKSSSACGGISKIILYGLGWWLTRRRIGGPALTERRHE
jgi:REP element-mobilizing transposase RayT